MEQQEYNNIRTLIVNLINEKFNELKDYIDDKINELNSGS